MAAHPWSINAKDFLSQVSPYMQRKTVDHYVGGAEGGEFVSGGADVNSWSQGKVDEGMTLTLADGRKWVPAGGDAGVTFHPATPAVPASGDGENYVPAQPAQEAYYSVIGDASNLNPNQKGGEQRIIVNYKQVGDQMVPMGEPVVEGYKHGFYNQNKGLVNFGLMAATMGTAASAAGAATATGAAPATGATLGGIEVGGSAGIGSGTVLGGAGVTAGEVAGGLVPLTAQTIVPGASAVTNITAGADAAGKIALATASGPLPMSELMATTGLTASEIVAAGGVTSGSVAGASGATYSEILKRYGPTAAKMLLAAGIVDDKKSGSGDSGSGGTSDIDSLISGALGNIDSMKKDYETQFLPWATDQLGQLTDRTNKAYDGTMALATKPNAMLDKFGNYVDMLGSEAYGNKVAGAAMGEAQQQGDNALAQQRRAAMARGVDPSKFALQSGAMNIGIAGNKAFAGAQARDSARNAYGTGLQAGAGLSMADTNMRGGLYRSAADMSQIPLNAGMKLATVDGAYRGGLNQNYTNLINARTSANNSANAQANSANAQANYDQSHSLSGVMQTGLVNGLANWTFGSGKSDTSSGGVVGKGLDAASNYFFGT